MGPHTETELILNYMERLLDKFENKRYFLLSHLMTITHGNENGASALDKVYYDFLSRIQSRGHLENTILFFYSDHGIRFGNIRQTKIGRLEERLPALYISFPKLFQERYADRMRNVRTNARRLTTPFDIHATLLDLLGLYKPGNTAKKGMQRGLSLFTEIPPERTCKDATIAGHWCACNVETPINPDDPVVQKAAIFVVSKMNDDLREHGDSCVQLTLEVIATARTLEVKRPFNVGRYSFPQSMYQFSFETSPGRGLFEATTMHQSNGVFTLIGDISRVNMYGGQSDCITHVRHKLFCYCKSFLVNSTINSKSNHPGNTGYLNWSAQNEQSKESKERIGRQNSSNSVDSERHIKGKRLSNISHHKEDFVYRPTL